MEETPDTVTIYGSTTRNGDATTFSVGLRDKTEDQIRRWVEAEPGRVMWKVEVPWEDVHPRPDLPTEVGTVINARINRKDEFVLAARDEGVGGANWIPLNGRGDSWSDDDIVEWTPLSETARRPTPPPIQTDSIIHVKDLARFLMSADRVGMSHMQRAEETIDYVLGRKKYVG